MPSFAFDKTGFKIGIDWSKQSWDGTSAKVEGDWVHIKLELSGKPAMYVKEYKYGENQIVTPIDKDATILECDMHYKYNTIKFVLGFGLDCKVLEPTWLKEEVISIAQKMIHNS
jgi:predicted DNA-binding transcriptional regulator YafY